MIITKILATIALGYAAVAAAFLVRDSVRADDSNETGRGLVIFSVSVIAISAIWGL